MRRFMPLLAAAAIVLSTGVACAERGQLAKLLADDGAVDDEFGYSVAISGTTAIVGAAQDDDNSPDRGSAYLFDISDPANPTQIAKLVPIVVGDIAPGNFIPVFYDFGISVAISGASAIVGTRGGLLNCEPAAYLFDISDPANPTQIAKLLANDGAPGDWFGGSVAISGATAIVSAWGSGSAYLFDTTTGQQTAKLLPDDGAALSDSVSISGATAIVGANGSGSAYLFDTTTGQQIAKLLPDDGAAKAKGGRMDQHIPDKGFGVSVAIWGATAIVGSVGDPGSAYLFDSATGQQIAKIVGEAGVPNDPFGGLFSKGDEFGQSVAISGATVIVGAPHDDDNGFFSGSAYLFDISDPANPTQIAKLLPNDGEGATGNAIPAGDQFGISVAIFRTTAIVGAYFDNDNGRDSGSAYLFDTTVGQ